MKFVLDIQTLLVCVGAVNMLFAVAVSIAWFRSGRNAVIGWWALAMLAGAVGPAMKLLDAVSKTGAPPQIANAIIIMATGFLLLGVRAFFDRPVRYDLALGGGLIYLVFSLVFEGSSIAQIGRMAIYLFFPALQLLLVAMTIQRGRTNERLPSQNLASVVFLTFVLAKAAAFIAFLMDPGNIIAGLPTAGWFAFMVLETLMHTVACCFMLMVLMKERIEDRLRVLAETDLLTGIRNRRAFVNDAEARLAFGVAPMALALFDLDHFKRINDTYGHQAGDAALKHFTAVLSANMTETMTFGRLGGEEFVVLSEAGDPEATLAAMDQLRQAILVTHLIPEAGALAMTVSVGVAFTEDCGRNLDHLLAAADCALYIAKDAGRNRICRFTPSQRLTTVTENGETKRVGQMDQRISRRAVRSSAPKQTVL